MPPISRAGSLRRLLMVAVVLGALALGASACSDDDDDTRSTEATDQGTDETLDQEAEAAAPSAGGATLNEAVDELAVACRAQDRDPCET